MGKHLSIMFVDANYFVTIQVFLGHSGGLDTDGNELPRLIYVSREKRPGFQHHKKAGAMNALVRHIFDFLLCSLLFNGLEAVYCVIRQEAVYACYDYISREFLSLLLSMLF